MYTHARIHTCRGASCTAAVPLHSGALPMVPGMDPHSLLAGGCAPKVKVNSAEIKLSAE